MKKESYKKTLVLVPSAYSHKAMGDVENFIKFYKDDFDIYFLWDKKNEVKDGVNYIYKGNPEALYYVLTADYIIDAGSINGYSKISHYQKRVSVWHGIPYKKMFVDLDSKNIDGALNYDYGVDLMVSPSKFYTEEFLRKSMLYKGEILETAVSRTDSLFLSEQEKDALKEELNIPKNKKVLLYAPTFREEGKMKLPFNPIKLKEALEKDGNEWVIVTKMHYLNTLKNKFGIIDCTNYAYINNLLAIADLLITDYSSLFFDYSILDKPAIFYQYDKDLYFDDRGVMFNLTDYVDKKYIVRDEKSLYKTISKTNNKANLEKIKKEFYPHQKPNATAELVKKLDFKPGIRKTKDIIFLINELNQLGGVNNFVMNFAKYFKEKYNSKVMIIAMKEFAENNTVNYVIDEENLIDIKISAEKNPAHVKSILTNTDGYIISCQFSAHKKFEHYLKDKNVFLMFHGNGYDVVNRRYYTWHLDSLNKKRMCNYKKLLFLTDKYSEAVKEALNKDLKDTVDYIENSFDFSDRKEYYKASNEFAVLSRIDDDKNIFNLIDIFKDEKLNKNYKVHVYGDGKLKDKFISEIKKNKLENRIICHGYVTDKDMMYKDKQGIIMTSFSEGFPLTILEAAKYGVPIYLYESVVTSKAFERSNAINVVKTMDTKDFVEKLNNPKKFTAKDYDALIDYCSNESVFNRWLDLFEKIKSLKSVKPGLKEKLSYLVKTKLQELKAKIKRRIFRHFKKHMIHRVKICLDYILFYIFKLKRLTINRYKEPLVSIIVPFYNANETIEALIKSINKSGYKNTEIIIVNDGSKDDPTEIVNKYKNVRYYYKHNEGPGLTRNFAIDKAKGEYMFFIDSDDTMYKGTLNYLVDFALKHKLNLVSGRCRRVVVDSKKRSYWFRNIYSRNYVNTFANRSILIDDALTTNKLYKVDEFRKSGIRFLPGLYEDKPFSYQLYAYYDRIGIIKNTVYNWLVYGKDTSISTTSTLDNIGDRIDKMQIIWNMSEDKFKRALMRVFINHDLTIFANNYNSYSKKDKKTVFNMFREFFEQTKDYIYLNDVPLIKKKELMIALMDNDFERFDTIAYYFSEAYKKVMEESLTK